MLSGKTELRSSAKLVLVTLLEHVDPDGRTWVGIETLAADASIGSTQTVRNALHQLAESGWLQIVQQTWASLTSEQIAAGRKAPRRGDAGQAPNLYIVLDGHGNPASGHAGPGLAHAFGSNSPPKTTTSDPPQILEGGPYQKQQGGPLPKLIGDQDPSEDRSMNESVERPRRIDRGTHISSKSRKKGEENLIGWDVLVQAHAEKTKAVYGLPPLAPDLKGDQRNALSEMLEGAAVDVRAQLCTRTGVEHELDEVRRELAKRTMNLYFKRDNEHLRRVKHALRDLPREFHARLTEAMQMLLRESHDAARPRRVQVQEPLERVEFVDKPVEIEPKKQQILPSPPADKPVEAGASNEPKRTASPPQTTSSASMDTAREARRLLEALNTSPQQELFRPSNNVAPTPTKSAKSASSEHKQAPTQRRVSEDKPSQDKLAPERSAEKYFEPQQFEDQPSAPATRSERPLGRGGAPRWGAIVPRPTTVVTPTKERRVRTRTRNHADSQEEHGGGSTSNE
ncbi:MAG TPA: helix-turn-helix domain-containing protein [Polyangium sp.]|nr:helix-turn-helix domain-containing protein [Polyangium sp.]